MHRSTAAQALRTTLTTLAAIATAASPGAAIGEEAAQPGLRAPSTIRELTLDQCLEEAMQGNRRRRVSQFAVAMAEAQHRQALAGYWPQVGVKGGYQRMDASPDFLFPATQTNVPAGTATITLPPGVVGPNAVQIPVSTPAQSIPVAAQDVKLANPDTFVASLDVSWLLFDGGMRKGLGQQAAALVDVMRQEARRTDLEIADSVVRLYHGAVLARGLVGVGEATLQRMEATLELTAAMYRGGSGKVMKTDWLDNRVMVETLRAMVAQLEKNEAMAEAALANTMGLPWSASTRPADREIPFVPSSGDLDALVETAYRSNPDWAQVDAGIRAAEGAVLTAKSEFLPRLAVTGEAHRFWNSYDAGMATSNNKAGWTIGVGAQLPLFSGFLTRNRVDEAATRVAKIKEEQLLLKDGIGIEVKMAFLDVAAAAKACQSTLDAMSAASESRDLTARAYETGMMETEKVVRAQLMEALMTAQHLKARYDHVAAQSRLELLVGRDLASRRSRTP